MRKAPTAWSRFLATRKRTLSLVVGLSQEQTDFSPGGDRWSVGEVLDHLVLVDGLLGGELAELIERRKAKAGGSVRLIRTLSDSGFSVPMVPDAVLPFFDLPAAMAGIFFPRPVREAVFRNRAVPTKAPRRIEPRSGRSVEALRGDLSNLPGALEGYLALEPSIDWSRLRYYHPLTGFTDARGIVSFIENHERRHQKQLRDVLEADAFPRAA